MKKFGTTVPLFSFERSNQRVTNGSRVTRCSTMSALRRFCLLVVYSAVGVLGTIILIEYHKTAITHKVSNIPLENHHEGRRDVLVDESGVIIGVEVFDDDVSDFKYRNQSKLANSSHILSNVTTEAVPTFKINSNLVEPKNWKGGGYFQVPSKEPLTNRCNTCALVTSSGHLVGAKAGSEIDQADCVIRMNAAPTDKYSLDVGKRTTFRIVGHRNFPRMFDTEQERQYHFLTPGSKSDAIVVAWLYGVNVKRNIETILSDRYAKKYTATKFYLTSEEVMLRNEKLFYQMLDIKKPTKHLWMSTGWTTMLFALEVCDKIHVYGMTYEEYCSEHPKDNKYYHYFDRLRRACSYFNISESRIGTGHKFLTEKLAFAHWAYKYNITFHHPSWEGHITNSIWESPFHMTYVKYQQDKAAKDALAKLKEEAAPLIGKR